jgi:hypothetical protein
MKGLQDLTFTELCEASQCATEGEREIYQKEKGKHKKTSNI